MTVTVTVTLSITMTVTVTVCRCSNDQCYKIFNPNSEPDLEQQANRTMLWVGLALIIVGALFGLYFLWRMIVACIRVPKYLEEYAAPAALPGYSAKPAAPVAYDM